MALGDASVEIIPDVSKFEATLTKAVNGALKGVVVQVEKAGDQITADFVQTARQADQALAKVDGDKFTEVRKQAKKAGDDVGNSLKEGAKEGDKAMKNLAESAGFAAATAAIVAFAKSSINAFADLGETLSKAEVIFGDATEQIVRFGDDAATALGQSKQAAIAAASDFAIFGKAAGLTGSELATFSTDLTMLASDLASFSNTTPEEAVLALGAALRGESEPIRRYGVLLDEATLKARALKMGIFDGNGALSQQQRVLAAQAEIFAQTTLAQGDFARTSDSLTNSQKTLTAQVKDLQVEIGAALAPAMATAVSAGSDLVGLFQALPKSVQATAAISVIAGGAFVTASKAIQNLGIAAGTANKALGSIGIVLTAAAVIYGTYSSSKQAAAASTEDFVTALQAEADGQQGAIEAAIKREIIDRRLLTSVQSLGVGYNELASYIMGESVPALEEFAKRTNDPGFFSMDRNSDELFRYSESLGMTVEEVQAMRDNLDLLRSSYAGANTELQAIEAEQALLANTYRGSAADLREFNLAVSGSSKMNREQARTTEEVAEAQEKANEALEEARSKLEEAIDAQWRWLDAQMAAVNSDIAYRASLQQTIQAFADLAVATDDPTTAVNEYEQALITAEQAALRQAQQAVETARANGELGDETEQAANAQRMMVDQLRYVAGTLDANDPLRKNLTAYADSLAEDIPDEVLTQAQLEVEDALAVAQQYVDDADEIGIEVGEAISSGVATGVENNADKIRQKLQAAANRALELAKAALGIASPSRVFAEEVGEPIVEGIAVGIVEGQRSAVRAITTVGDDLTTRALSTVESFNDAMGALADQARNTYDSIWAQIEGRRSAQEQARRTRDAEDGVAEAQGAVNAAIAEFGRNSPEARRAAEELADAQERLRDEYYRQLEASIDLVTQGDAQVEMFKDIARRAGLSATEIDGLVQSYQALATAQQQAQLAEQEAAATEAAFDRADLEYRVAEAEQASSAAWQELTDNLRNDPRNEEGNREGLIESFAQALFDRAAVRAEAAGINERTRAWANYVRASLSSDRANMPLLAPAIDQILSRIPQFARGGIFDSPTVGMIGEAGREAVIPITRPGRALQLMEQSGLADLVRSSSSAAVNIQHATFVGRSDADLVAQKVAAATRARIFAA